jgi:hypothetical protein
VLHIWPAGAGIGDRPTSPLELAFRHAVKVSGTRLVMSGFRVRNEGWYAFD